MPQARSSSREVVLRHTIRAVVIGVLSLVPFCFGYGGFEVSAGFVDFKGLNRNFSILNQFDSAIGGIGGTGSFNYRGPLWWYGGSGGDHVGPVTLGGSGAFAARANQADSLGSEGTGSGPSGHTRSRIRLCRSRSGVGSRYGPTRSCPRRFSPRTPAATRCGSGRSSMISLIRS